MLGSKAKRPRAPASRRHRICHFKYPDSSTIRIKCQRVSVEASRPLRELRGTHPSSAVVPVTLRSRPPSDMSRTRLTRASCMTAGGCRSGSRSQSSSTRIIRLNDWALPPPSGRGPIEWTRADAPHLRRRLRKAHAASLRGVAHGRVPRLAPGLLRARG